MVWLCITVTTRPWFSPLIISYLDHSKNFPAGLPAFILPSCGTCYIICRAQYKNENAGLLVRKKKKKKNFKIWQQNIKTSTRALLRGGPLWLQRSQVHEAGLAPWVSLGHWLPVWHAASSAWNILPPPSFSLWCTTRLSINMWPALGSFPWTFLLKSLFLQFFPSSGT